MLRELKPIEADKNWDVVWTAICAALPGYGQKELVLRKAVNEGRLTVWASFRPSTAKVNGIVLTAIHCDVILQETTLFIYAAWTSEQTTRRDWQEGFASLNAYAQKLGVPTISFYTSNPKWLHIAQQMKAFTEHHVVAPVLEANHES